MPKMSSRKGESAGRASDTPEERGGAPGCAHDVREEGESAGSAQGVPEEGKSAERAHGFARWGRKMLFAFLSLALGLNPTDTSFEVLANQPSTNRALRTSLVTVCEGGSDRL